MTSNSLCSLCAWSGCDSSNTTWKDLSSSIRVKICKKHERFLPK